MRASPMVAAAIAVATAPVGTLVAGCNSKPSSTAASQSTTSATTSHSSASGSAPAQPTDYTRLLIRADEINAPETFTAGPPTLNPNGKNGVSTTFSDDDGSHVIIDTILVLPDPAAAAAALGAEKATLPGSGTATPIPVDVGTGGTKVSGDSPDGSKGITVLRFTEGRAFATLEFDGPASIPAPPDFVTGVGQKQDAAIKNGLPA